MATYHITPLPHTVNLIISKDGFLSSRRVLTSNNPVSVSVLWSCSVFDKKKIFRTLCVRSESRLFSSSPSASEEDAEMMKLSWQQQKSSVSVSDYPDFKREIRNGGRPREEAPYPPLPTENVVSSENKGLDIASLGLHNALVLALQKRGITHMFPIQEAVFKPATEGIDIIGRARTGTGKTLAFGIPIIQSLLQQNEQNRSRRFNRNPKVLVLAPTRELAIQVEKEFMESAPNLSTLCVYGGVSIVGQQRKLQRGVDIVVGTPGRIIDLIERGSLMLNEVSYLVLDEADQMLAIGFAEDVERILESVPTERQSMLFSATMPDWVKKLARKYLRQPLTIDLVGDSEEKLAEGIKMLSIPIPASAKRSVLSDLITVYGKGRKSIVFTQTKRDADEVAMSMNRMLGTEALHGDISQAQREKTLASFRNGKFSVLVATDVAARGLDIPNVDLVIHFEIPNDPETFVHRSGRTGRAGKEGITILMHTDSQIRTVRMIERDVGCKFELISAPSPHDVLRSSSEQAREALSKVHPDLRSIFLPTAEILLQEQGAHALAAAIAHLSGFTQPPASRSLITHEQGWMTLQFTRPQRWGAGGLSSPGGVMGALGAIYPKAADEVGKILMLDPSVGVGAVFDLPEDVAKELLALPLSPDDCIEAILKLPRLQYNDAPQDRYGRFSGQGGRMGGGRPMMNRQQYGGRSSGAGSWGSYKRDGQQQPGGWEGYQGNAGGYRGNASGYQGNNGGYQGYNGGYQGNNGGYKGNSGGYQGNNGGFQR